MWKTLRILCLTLALVGPACSRQSEVTVAVPKLVTTTTSTTSTTTTAPPTTTTTIPPTTTTTVRRTTTTLKESTYQAASVSSNTWDVIASCESGGNWGSRSGAYEGGLQFGPSTWTSYVAAGKDYALVGYPAHAYDATREQQITVAERVRDGVKGSRDPYLNPQGYGAWPTCRHKAGV